MPPPKHQSTNAPTRVGRPCWARREGKSSDLWGARRRERRSGERGEGGCHGEREAAREREASDGGARWGRLSYERGRGGVCALRNPQSGPEVLFPLPTRVVLQQRVSPPCPFSALLTFVRAPVWLGSVARLVASVVSSFDPLTGGLDAILVSLTQLLEQVPECGMEEAQEVVSQGARRAVVGRCYPDKGGRCNFVWGLRRGVALGKPLRRACEGTRQRRRPSLRIFRNHVRTHRQA